MTPEELIAQAQAELSNAIGWASFAQRHLRQARNLRLADQLDMMVRAMRDLANELREDQP